MDSIISASSSTSRIFFVAAGVAALVAFLARVAFFARFAAGIESTITSGRVGWNLRGSPDVQPYSSRLVWV